MNAILLCMLAAVAADGKPSGATVQEPKITYECRGIFAKQALEELSKSAGVTLETATSTADEVLAISVMDVPLSALLASIALATNAEWETDSKGVRRLVRSASLLKKQSQAHFDARLQAVKTGQENLRKRIEEHPDYTDASVGKFAAELGAFFDSLKQNPNQPPNWQAQRRLNDRMPAAMLTDRIGVLLDPRELAAIGPDEKAVYSLHPTRMQRAFPNAVTALLNRFADSSRRLSEAFKGGIDENAMRFGTDLYSALQKRSMEDSVPADVLLKVTSQSDRSVATQLTVINAKGKSIGEYHGSIVLSKSSNDIFEKPDPAPEGERPVELDPLPAEMIKALQTAMQRGGSPEDIPELTAGLREVLLHPDRQDLSALGTGPVLVQVAKARKENLVASIPDLYGFIVPMIFAMGSTTPSQIMRIGKINEMPLSVEEKDGWMTIRPTDPVQARDMHVDHRLLGKMLRNAVSLGYLALDDLAEFAVSGPRDVQESIAVPYLMMLMPSGLGDYERLNSAFLKLHGMLSLQQKQAMASGKAIPISQLTPQLRECVEKIVYGDRTTGIQYKKPMKEEDSDLFNSILMEPTVRFGNGLPPNAMLSLTYTSGMNIKAAGLYDGQYRSNEDFSIDALAYYLESKDRVPNNTAYNSFKVEMKSTYRYLIDLDDTIAYNGELTERVPKGKPVTSPDKLPPDIWKQVQATIAKINSDRNGGKIPPRR